MYGCLFILILLASIIRKLINHNFESKLILYVVNKFDKICGFNRIWTLEPVTFLTTLNRSGGDTHIVLVRIIKRFVFG